MKAKSLVDVVRDSVFGNFPLDNERYELVLKLVEIVTAFSEGDSLIFYPQAEENLDVFLCQTNERFTQGARSYARFITRDPDLELPSIVEDRAWRVYCSFSSDHPIRRISFELEPDRIEAETYCALWVELFVRFAPSLTWQGHFETTQMQRFLHRTKGDNP